MLTISPELQKRLQKYSYDIVQAIQVIGARTYSLLMILPRDAWS